MAYFPPKSWALPLATKYLNLDEDERSFFKAATQIDDDVELDKHILEVQAKAFEVCHLLDVDRLLSSLTRVVRYFPTLAYVSSVSQGSNISLAHYVKCAMTFSWMFATDLLLPGYGSPAFRHIGIF